MPPVVAAAIVTGIAGAGTAAIGAKSASGASKRAISAQERAAARAEAAAREEDALNRAEDKRRWDAEQANLARKQAQEDALLKDNLERANYEDAIRYGKMVNLARLTGQPAPPPLPKRTTLDTLASLNAPPRATTMPIASAPSAANAMIASESDPFAFPQRMPISRLSRRVS